MQVIFIADFFTDQIYGGGEVYNDVLIKLLNESGHEIERRNCSSITEEFINSNKDSLFVVGNFVSLKNNIKYLLCNKKYIIIEHDYKFLKDRNPAKYLNFLAPEEHIINFDFYKNAQKIICQTKLHYDIFKKNLKLDNIVNFGGSLWSIEDLGYIASLNSNEKVDKVAILKSDIWHKNTQGAIEYCKKNNLEYELVGNLSYHNFLKELTLYKSLVFLPQTPETCSRLVCEAKMMGVSVIANKLVGACSEDWIKLSGLEIIDVMRKKHVEIVEEIN